MKRDTVKNFGMNRVWPILFWEKYISCYQEFRREWGWTLQQGYYKVYYTSVCAECCPTAKEAYDKINEPPKRPTPPPMPPRAGASAIRPQVKLKLVENPLDDEVF